LQNYKKISIFAAKLIVKMKKSSYLITQFPLTAILIVLIWVVCLIPIPETPLDDVPLIDKWTHFVLYGGLCSVAWMEYGWHSPLRSRRWLAGWLAVAPFLMGGLIEIVQATCTNGVRSGDWTDWVADGIGVALGQAIGIPLARVAARWNKAR
jgi:VanZ family protein